MVECSTVETGIQCSIIVGVIDWCKYYDYYGIVVRVANVFVFS